MTQTQTTAERIDKLIGDNSIPMPNGWAQTSPDATQHVAETIAAEIDALTAERDAARESLGYVQAETDAMYRRVVMLEAEVERFRPAAEAWKAREAQRIAFETFDRDPTPGNHDALTDANMAMLGTGLRARAAKEAKP